MLKNYDELSPVAIDCLKEIGNIGSGSAASSLSEMLGKPVEMKVPDVSVLDYDQVIHQMGGPEKVITGILVQLFGDIKGMIMFLLEDSFAQVVLKTFLQTDNVTVMSLDETQLSVIKEMGNIMAGAYLRALSTLTGLTIDMDVPSMTVDMLGAIMSVPIIEFSEVGDKVLFIDDGFVIDNVDIKSNIILIPEMESLDTLMKKLGVL
jgi:chemotaxis protein CheC